MSNSLDYEAILEQPSRKSGGILVVIGTVVLAPVHLVFCGFVSFHLFVLTGGVPTSILGRWMSYEGIDYAWTNIAWLATGLLMIVGDGGVLHAPPLGSVAVLMLFAGSIYAAYLLTSVVVETVRGSREFGRYRWKLWACGLAWLGWVPVPVKMTITYWHTVAY